MIKVNNCISKNYRDVPKVGNRTIDNEVVTKVDTSVYNEYCLYALTLIKDYSGISDFISVDSAFRQYRVPKEGYVTRNDIYEEDWSVGTQFKSSENRSHTILTLGGINNMVGTLVNSNNPDLNNITYCRYSSRFKNLSPGDLDTTKEELPVIQPASPAVGDRYYDETVGIDSLFEWNGSLWDDLGILPKSEIENASIGDMWWDLDTNELHTYYDIWETFDRVSHATVNVTPQGTSTVIDISMKDNYSAGNLRVAGEYQIDNKDVVFQDDYPYSDEFGQLDSVRIEFYTSGYNFDFGSLQIASDLYPSADWITSEPNGIKLASIDIRKKKDAREKLRDTYQINFFSQLDSLGQEEVRLYNGISKYNGFNTGIGVSNIIPVLLLQGYFPDHNDVVIDETKIGYIGDFTSDSVTVVANDLVYLNYSFDIPPTDQIPSDTVSERAIHYNGYALIDEASKELILAVKDEILNEGSIPNNYADRIYFFSDKTKGL